MSVEDVWKVIKELYHIKVEETSIINKILCNKNEKIEEAAEETQPQEELNEKEVTMLNEKIDAVKY